MMNSITDIRIYLNDVLFTLFASSNLKWPDLNRTNFQKILFFCATLAPLVKLEWGYSFINAPYGPFNSEIHNAPDILVVRYRFAEVTNLTLQRDSKIRANYRITEFGKREALRIIKLNKERERYDWIETIMKVLDIYGPKIITKLAYKEPTFNTIRRQNQRIIDLSINENRSIELINQLIEELDVRYSLELDTILSRLIVYFDFLSSEI